jgi:serine/threonine protein kinase
MGYTEVREGFGAYASGRLSERALRDALNDALRREPELAAVYIALTSGLRRGNVISEALEARILADIAAVTGHSTHKPQAQTESYDSVARTVFKGRGSAASNLKGDPGLGDIGRLTTNDLVANEPVHVNPAITTGPSTTGGSTTGSAWDTPERLAEPAIALSVGSILKHRFELIEELGHGGMGIVYKSLDHVTAEFKDRNPYVAIKLLNEEFKRHPLAVRALQREARKAQKLAHPNIVSVFDFDRDGGNVYMVMELLIGQSLDQLQRSQYPDGFPLRKVTEYLGGMGAGLSYAHEQGIVHADFKPSNAFLTKDGVIKVLDFGVARAARSLNDPGEKTIFDAGQLGAVSPAYASVEMLTGQDPDPRDDVYALACVTYVLLTGRHPFNKIESVKAREAGLQPPPVKGLSRGQWQALRRGLAFDRGARTGSVKEFVAQFSTRPRRRNIWLPITAAVAALALLAVVLLPEQWLTYQAGKLTKALQSGDPQTFSVAMASLESAPETLRRRVLLDDAVRKSILDHYTLDIQTAAAPPDDNFVHARELLEQLKRLLPDSQVVADIAAGLDVDAKAAPTEQPQKPDSAPAPETPVPDQGADNLAARDELSRLVAKPEASQHWADQLRAALQKLSTSMPADDPLLTDARRTADATFAQAAADARAHRRLADASSLIALGRTVDPDSPDLTREAATVASEESTSTVAAANAEQQAGIDVLKQKLAQQADAGDVAGANATANALRRVLAGSMYVSNELPQRLIESYVRLAKKQLLAGSPDAALQTIALGRKRFGSASDLKNLELRYITVGDAFDRLSIAVALNVNEQQNYLESLRASEGPDFPDIERMLANTLANRIADERAANRPTVAASLLDAGRKVFPENSALLEQGTAGMLSVPTAVVEQ